MTNVNEDVIRLLPCDAEAERAVLGSIMLDASAYYSASEVVTADDFYHEPHRIIFMRMSDLASSSRAIDVFTLRSELKRHDQEEKIGGVIALAKLTDGLPRSLNVRHYAEIVRQHATARRLINLCRETSERCYDGGDQPAKILEGHEAELFKLAAREARGGFESASDIVPRVYQQIEEASNQRRAVSGLSTGFAELDKMTAGLHPSNLTIIAGRPGLGKTSFCMNIADHVAIGLGMSVGIFSLEMSKDELMMRMLSSRAEVDQYKIRTGYVGREDWTRLSTASGEIAGARIYIDDGGDLTVTQLRAKAERLALEKGLHLLIIDYLQLLRGSGKRYDNRTAEVTDISRNLKAMAKELGIPVIAAAQLNRETERAARRPRLSDLRESGSIEQDADLVLLLYRDETVKESEDKDNSSAAEVIVGKQRNGRTGSFDLTFLKHYTKFVNQWKEP